MTQNNPPLNEKALLCEADPDCYFCKGKGYTINYIQSGKNICPCVRLITPTKPSVGDGELREAILGILCGVTPSELEGRSSIANGRVKRLADALAASQMGEK